MTKCYRNDYEGQWTEKMSQNFEDDLKCWPNEGKTEEVRLFLSAQSTFMI